MSAKVQPHALFARDEIVAAPVLPASPPLADRSFEIPTGLMASVFGLFIAYLVVMSIGFADEGIVIPMAINFIFVTAFFVVPFLWTRMSPESRTPALDYDRFREEGIVTGSGHASAGSATAQLLVVPVLLLLWGVAVTTLWAIL